MINSSDIINKYNIHLEIIDEYEEYYLIKENNVYKIIIGKENNFIFIKCKNYQILINNIGLSKIIKSMIQTIDEAYEFIINIFENNKVIIKDIKKNKYLKLILKVNILNEEKDFELILENNKNLLFNKFNITYKKLYIEINRLKEEILLLKKELEKLKNNKNNKQRNCNDIINNNKIIKVESKENYKNKENNLICKNIKFLKDLVNDSYSDLWLANTFIVFKSISNIVYLIYTNKKNSIISYDIIDNKKINEIKNAHEEYITNLKYYLDNVNNRDLFITISCEDNNIKLWNINNFECLLDIKNINQRGCLYSACFLKDTKQIFIITSNSESNNINSQSIKVFDLTGNKIKEIKDSNKNICFIETYFDNKLFNNFILACTDHHSISYDYNRNKIYKKYSNDNMAQNIKSLVIINREDIVELIESSYEGNIRIWNFHSGLLLKNIKVKNNGLREICLWDNEYLFVGCDDKTIKLIN